MWQAIVASFLANVAWGTTFFASKVLLADFSPHFILVARFGLASLMFACFLLVQQSGRAFFRQISRANWINLGVYSLLVIPGTYLPQLIGLQYIASSEAAIICHVSPVITALFAMMILHEGISKRRFLGFVCTLLASVFFLTIPTEVNRYGLVLNLLSATSLAASAIWLRAQLTAIPAHITTLVSFAIGLPFLLLWQTPQSYLWQFAHVTMSHVVAFLYLSLVCTVFSFYAWNWATSRIPAVISATAMAVKLPIAIILGTILLAESFPETYVFAASGLFVGAFLVVYQPQRYHLKKFSPDLIIEIIKLCNMRVGGCYSENRFTRETTLSEDELLRLAEQRKILPQETLVQYLNACQPGQRVALRGGELTLYPALGKILRPFAERGVRFILETNGLWMLRDNGPKLHEWCTLPNLEIKLSTGPMHNTSLQLITKALEVVPRPALSFAITTLTQKECLTFAKNMHIPVAATIYWQRLVESVHALEVECDAVVQVDGRLIKDFACYEV
ncbi:MAG: EamA family transporter [Deltaproteobacteria bacterium]|nr:EamA family transporter [Deltaproteobacteria bacterium]